MHGKQKHPQNFTFPRRKVVEHAIQDGHVLLDDGSAVEYRDSIVPVLDLAQRRNDGWLAEDGVGQDGSRWNPRHVHHRTVACSFELVEHARVT
jgi:hypothetical protein